MKLGFSLRGPPHPYTACSKDFVHEVSLRRNFRIRKTPDMIAPFTEGCMQNLSHSKSISGFPPMVMVLVVMTP